jgi:glycosyltransferase involved in cell wall biosynthesis
VLDPSHADPDVSVIVIAHDVRDEVLAALGSVEEHKGRLSVETILVDNGSTDATAESVAEAFPETRVVRLQRNIAFAARNEGLRIARGRYRMFLDSDALLTSGALDELVRFLGSTPKLAWSDPASSTQMAPSSTQPGAIRRSCCLYCSDRRSTVSSRRATPSGVI